MVDNAVKVPQSAARLRGLGLEKDHWIFASKRYL